MSSGYQTNRAYRFYSIVFVHGLTGNRETTWTHKQTQSFWPQTLLVRDLPKARILTFGYDADIIGTLTPAGSNTLRDHGKSLANDLALRRMRSGSVRKRPDTGSLQLLRAEESTASHLCRSQPWRASGRTGRLSTLMTHQAEFS